MRHLFQKYYIEVSAFELNDNGIGVTTDNYYVDKKGSLSKERPMKQHAQVFGFFKGAAMVKKIQKLYDKSKWAVAMVEVNNMDFINYVQKGEE